MASKSSNNASQRAAREAKVRALWKRRELAPWAAALAAAPARAARPSAGPRLSAKPELDEFYFEELPRQLQGSLRSSSSLSRPPSSSCPSSSSSCSSLAALTAEQLAGVVEWKLARGTWRPRLLDFAKAARQADVAAAAAAAAGALESGEVGPAIDALCALKGVGPATATALLSAADPSVPFLSDEALIAVLGAREYSRPAALRVTEALRARAEELNDAQRGKGEEEKAGEERERGGRSSSSSSSSWTASKVERALWSASRAEDDEKGGEGEEKGEAANEEKDEKKKKKKRRKLG